MTTETFSFPDLTTLNSSDHDSTPNPPQTEEDMTFNVKLTYEYLTEYPPFVIPTMVLPEGISPTPQWFLDLAPKPKTDTSIRHLAGPEMDECFHIARRMVVELSKTLSNILDSHELINSTFSDALTKAMTDPDRKLLTFYPGLKIGKVLEATDVPRDVVRDHRKAAAVALARSQRENGVGKYGGGSSNHIWWPKDRSTGK